jgi:hypothetical protein
MNKNEIIKKEASVSNLLLLFQKLTLKQLNDYFVKRQSEIESDNNKRVYSHSIFSIFKKKKTKEEIFTEKCRTYLDHSSKICLSRIALLLNFQPNQSNKP